MSKKVFKSQASSSRAISGTFWAQDAGSAHSVFGSAPAFGAIASSPLSYIYEPPGLSSISEPNVIVALKNLQKKDSITKSRALDDLQNHVLQLGVDKGGVEEEILEAWIKVYPRTSIDSARRVRQLAHILQGQISASCGKRIAKHMPQLAGPWLAGLYDNDKSVVRAAHESLKQVFPTEEKMKGVWRVYQTSILEYASGTIINETIYSISDERTTSPDDASAKYARVIGSAILMVNNAIEELSAIDLKKQEDFFHQFLNQQALWNFAANSDPFVRRAVYKLAVIATLKQKDQLDMAMLSATILTSSLSISQTGSALEYAKTIALLTAKSPHIWTDFNKGSVKKAPARRLLQFLKNGSQGGPPEFWAQVAALIEQLPLSILLYGSEEQLDKSLETSTEQNFPVLKALHDGITSRDEPRANQVAAWDAYLVTLDRISLSLPNQNDRDNLTKYSILPMVKEHVRPSSIKSGWTVLGLEGENTCVRAFRQILRISQTVFYEGWHQLSSKMIEDIRTSLPEQSGDYVKSHDLISANIGRWYKLQAAVLGLEIPDDLEALAAETVAAELKTAISVLREREGKPYSAATLLQNAITSLPQIVRCDRDINTLLTGFAKSDIPKLLLSPSAPQLAVTLSLLKEFIDVRPICDAGIKIIRDAPESSTKSNALESLISSSFLVQSFEIQALIKENLKLALYGDEARWALVSAAVANPVAPSKLTDDLLGCMANGLSIPEEVPPSLQGLELVIKRNDQAIRDYARSENGSNLLSKLLFLTESPDSNVSQKSLKLSTAIETIISKDTDSSHAVRSMIGVIRQGIDVASPSSLSVDSLVEQTRKLLSQTIYQGKPALARDLLPDSIQWKTAMRPFYTCLPNHSMSIMNPLHGAIALIDQTMKPEDETLNVDRDSNGYSSGLRMAWYALRIVKATKIIDLATEEQQILVYKNLALVTQFALHNLGVSGSNPLWDNVDVTLEFEIVDFVGDMQGLLASWVQSEQSMKSEVINKVRQQLFEESRGVSAASYYSGCAYSYLASEFVEVQGSSGLWEGMRPLSSMLKSPDIFTAAAILSSAPESRGLLRLCNELVADLTGCDFQKRIEEGFRQLVLLNCIIGKQEDLVVEIPQQRLVFFVKHMVSQMLKGISSKAIKFEIMTALRVILSPIKDIYDNFWSKIIDLVTNSWSIQTQIGDDGIPMLYASLQLVHTLKRLESGESNDDLQDSWKEKQGSMMESLINLLKQLQGTSDEAHDPRRVVNELLARQIKGLTQEPITNAIDLYPAIASKSLTLQVSAYEILHRHIPKAQEQTSLDRALEKDFIAKLPEELLSLVFSVPDLDSLTDLIFDHWTGSSYKVKGDYTACLKDRSYLPSLLDLIFEILIDSRSKPVNASQFTIESYSPNTSEAPKKEIQTLLIHLYYLCLKHVPNLSKAWWRDTTTRQTAIAVEAWTEKHISPLIIASELRAVSEWAPSQSTADQPLHIKVSASAGELTASIPIDEQIMSIAIRLPPSYPLSRATVESRHRVAVDEKKWRGWLIAAQGVINFSDSGSDGGGDGGPLIDGLLAWRRNVTATLKGQTECAICYSVVAADRQLPTKRCGTCRNCFHGSCLFRWFKSSNSSSCPLCRNAFHYG